MNKMLSLEVVSNSTKNWHQNNNNQCKSAEVSQRKAEVAIDDADQAGQESIKRANFGNCQVNLKLEERIEDLQFRHSELELQKKKLEDELADVSAVLKRVEEALDKCNEPFKITRKCIQQRLI
jgi:chromosome segregation ATPase